MTNDDKKKWLNQYPLITEKIKDIEYQIEELSLENCRLTSVITDMPRGTDHKHLDDIIIAKLDKMDKLKCIANNLRQEQDRIECSIATIDDLRVEKVMRLRYIEAKEWPDVFEEMRCESAQAYRLHGEGLKYIEIDL